MELKIIILNLNKKIIMKWIKMNNFLTFNRSTEFVISNKKVNQTRVLVIFLKTKSTLIFCLPFHIHIMWLHTYVMTIYHLLLSLISKKVIIYTYRYFKLSHCILSLFLFLETTVKNIKTCPGNQSCFFFP